MIEPLPIQRRYWPFVLLAALLFFGAAWAGFWYVAAGTAESTIDGWRAREAQSGRVYSCATQSIEGFPFRFALGCAGARVELRSNELPLVIRGKGLSVTAQLWRPTELRSDFFGPVTVEVPGQPAGLSAQWRSATVELHGLPAVPEHVELSVEEPALDRLPAGSLFRAAQVLLDGRIVAGSVQDHPVVEIALRLTGASAPGWHPAAAAPTDADVTAVLRGLDDFSPKPWPARLRQLQAAGGRIEIASARVQQGDIVATADGTLGLTPSGRLQGQLRLTIANMEQLLPLFGIDRMLEERTAPPEVESAIGALNRLVPGLGDVARRNAGPALVASARLMGKPAELEGRRAVMLPLRFDDGAVSLGPLPVGHVPPLF